MVPLSSSEIQHLASETAKSTVREFLLAMGVNANDPNALIEVQQDFAHIRRSRLAIAAVRSRAMMVAVGIVISGAMATMWMAISGKGH